MGLFCQIMPVLLHFIQKVYDRSKGVSCVSEKYRVGPRLMATSRFVKFEVV